MANAARVALTCIVAEVASGILGPYAYDTGFRRQGPEAHSLHRTPE